MTTLTPSRERAYRLATTFTILVGLVMLVAGVATWALVATQLSSEGITVNEDSRLFGGALVGAPVRDPLTAYAQADVIAHHALEMADGKTYAQLDREDPVRETVEKTAFLRASLFTSVISFGVAALVAGLGVVLLVVGSALRQIAPPRESTAAA